MAVQTNQSSRPFSGKASPCLSCAMSPSLLWEGTKPVSWGRTGAGRRVTPVATAVRVHACVIDNRIPDSMSEDHTKGES